MQNDQSARCSPDSPCTPAADLQTSRRWVSPEVLEGHPAEAWAVGTGVKDERAVLLMRCIPAVKRKREAFSSEVDAASGRLSGRNLRSDHSPSSSLTRTTRGLLSHGRGLLVSLPLRALWFLTSSRPGLSILPLRDLSPWTRRSSCVSLKNCMVSRIGEL